MDKAKELAILKMVYDTTHFKLVRHQERPDFALQYEGINEAFGVEITELYYSESDARLHNYPGYRDSLLDGGEHIHKKDVPALEVKLINILNENGDVVATDLTAIKREIPPSDVFARLLASTIRKKNEKMQDYLTGLSHVNLIVADKEAPFYMADPENLYKYLFISELKQILGRAAFNEVFLITRIKEQRLVYIPLRLILMLAEMYLFDWATADYYHSLTYSSADSRVYLFAEFLLKRGFPVSIHSTDIGIGIHVRRYTFVISEENRLTVRDSADLLITEADLPIQQSEHSDKLNNGFIKFYEDYIQRTTYEAGVAFDVLEEMYL